MKGVIPMYSEEEKECACGCHSAENTMELHESYEEDCIEVFDEDDNALNLKLIRYFSYNTDQYVVLGTDEAAKQLEGDTPINTEELEIYIMKVDVETDEDGDEVEVFSPVEDDELLEKLVQIATTKVKY